MTKETTKAPDVFAHAGAEKKDSDCTSSKENTTPKPTELSTLTPYQIAERMGWRMTPLNGKAPFEPDWPNLEGLTPKQAQARIDAGRNVGIICGNRSNRLIVVDVDGERPDGLTPTVEVVTGGGGGGAHLYYTVPEGVVLEKANKVRLADLDIDIRYTGGQAVYPGSVHPETGVIYEWREGFSPADIEVAEIPKWVIDAINAPALKVPKKAQATERNTKQGTNLPYAEAALNGACNDIANAKVGARNNTISRKAYKMGGYITTGNLDESEAIEALIAAAPIAPDFTEAEALKTIHSGIQAGKNEPLTPPAINQAKSRSSDALQGISIDVEHNLSEKELFRRVPVSRHKNREIADYQNAMSLGVAIREITGTLGDPEATLDDEEWAPLIASWCKRHKRDPEDVEASVIAHWPETAHGHKSKFLAASWAFRKDPEAYTGQELRHQTWRMAATFCMRLQEAAGLKPFFLSAQDLSDEVTAYTKTAKISVRFGTSAAKDRLACLVAKNILILVKKGDMHWANEYFFSEIYLQSYSPIEYLSPLGEEGSHNEKIEEGKTTSNKSQSDLPPLRIAGDGFASLGGTNLRRHQTQGD